MSEDLIKQARNIANRPYALMRRMKDIPPGSGMISLMKQLVYGDSFGGPALKISIFRPSLMFTSTASWWRGV